MEDAFSPEPEDRPRRCDLQSTDGTADLALSIAREAVRVAFDVRRCAAVARDGNDRPVTSTVAVPCLYAAEGGVPAEAAAAFEAFAQEVVAALDDRVKAKSSARRSLSVAVSCGQVADAAAATGAEDPLLRCWANVFQDRPCRLPLDSRRVVAGPSADHVAAHVRELIHGLGSDSGADAPRPPLHPVVVQLDVCAVTKGVQDPPVAALSGAAVFLIFAPLSSPLATLLKALALGTSRGQRPAGQPKPDEFRAFVTPDTTPTPSEGALEPPHGDGSAEAVAEALHAAGGFWAELCADAVVRRTALLTVASFVAPHEGGETVGAWLADLHQCLSSGASVATAQSLLRPVLARRDFGRRHTRRLSTVTATGDGPLPLHPTLPALPEDIVGRAGTALRFTAWKALRDLRPTAERWLWLRDTAGAPDVESAAAPGFDQGDWDAASRWLQALRPAAPSVTPGRLAGTTSFVPVDSTPFHDHAPAHTPARSIGNKPRLECPDPDDLSVPVADRLAGIDAALERLRTDRARIADDPLSPGPVQPEPHARGRESLGRVVRDGSVRFDDRVVAPLRPEDVVTQAAQQHPSQARSDSEASLVFVEEERMTEFEAGALATAVALEEARAAAAAAEARAAEAERQLAGVRGVAAETERALEEVSVAHARAAEVEATLQATVVAKDEALAALTALQAVAAPDTADASVAAAPDGADGCTQTTARATVGSATQCVAEPLRRTITAAVELLPSMCDAAATQTDFADHDKAEAARLAGVLEDSMQDRRGLVQAIRGVELARQEAQEKADAAEAEVREAQYTIAALQERNDELEATTAALTVHGEALARDAAVAERQREALVALDRIAEINDCPAARSRHCNACPPRVAPTKQFGAMPRSARTHTPRGSLTDLR